MILSPSQKRELLARQELFRKLSDRELDDLARGIQFRRVAARETLCRRGDPGNQLYLIVEGLLKAQATSPSGDDVVFSIMGAGEMFGELALLIGGQRTADVIAIRDSGLLVIDRRDLFPFMRRNPDGAIKLLEVLAARVERLTAKVEDKSFFNLPQRLSKALLELGARWGRKTPEGIAIDQRFSQAELGDLVATTRESVNKQMKTWEKEGVARMRNGYITLLDAPKLKDIAERGERNVGRRRSGRRD